jgi:serine O-acetyltransferase
MNKSIYDDLFRYTGKRSIRLLWRYVFFTPGFRYIYFLRKTQSANFIITKFLWKFLLRRCMLKTNIQIPPETSIGKGFRIAHFGSIVINPNTIIGINFNIANGAVIGSAEGQKKGTPIIGNNVSVHANAVIIGGVKIGHNVLIAPNAFVNIDIPNGAIALGNPCKIINRINASSKYIVYKV